MVDVDKIVENFRRKFEKMTKEEQLKYLKSVGFPINDSIFNDDQNNKNISKEVKSDEAPQR